MHDTGQPTAFASIADHAAKRHYTPDTMRRKTAATLHLTCGLPGAGKTTLARRLEHALPALRLTTDEWLTSLFGEDISFEESERYRARLEASLLGLAIRTVELGQDVVLDFGVWSRAEREEFRHRAAEVGARSELHYIEVPLAELLARLERRNADPATPVAFRITEDQMRLWQTWFETPAADELQPREPA